jgi:hypothetical protein
LDAICIIGYDVFIGQLSSTTVCWSGNFTKIPLVISSGVVSFLPRVVVTIDENVIAVQL